ncbi:MAG: hypothetical protein K8S56_06465 [Candidatus Cloacimonetes bacterium]|nr:hypothetical protein [Candidatus Cloacimonadota bacterium]
MKKNFGSNSSNHREEIRKLGQLSKRLLFLSFVLPLIFVLFNFLFFKLINGAYYATGLLLLGIGAFAAVQLLIHLKMKERSTTKHRMTIPKSEE